MNTMDTKTLTYLKMGIVGIFEVGVFAMAIAGKIPAQEAISASTAGVGILVGALGLTSGLQALGVALRKGGDK